MKIMTNFIQQLSLASPLLFELNSAPIHEEADTLMDELVTVIADPAIGYRHQWRPGDILIWNNITLQHARTDFDPSQPRTLRRVPIAVNEAQARDETATAP